MSVIDIDSHWEPVRNYASDDAKSARLELMVTNVSGDVLRNVPREQWPPLEAFVSPGLRAMLSSDGAADPTSSAPGAHDIPGRIAWCDEVGIDFQFVNGGGFTGTEHLIADPVERRATISRTNDLLLDALDGYAHRFAPIVNVDLTDLDGTLSELERCRARGSRAYHLRTEPPGGVSYAHSQFDRLWAATVDLGMTPYLHIGNTPSHFEPGWANVGIGDSEGPTGAGLMRLSNTARTQTLEIMLSALALGGVFARHPALTVLVAELWVGWMPFLLRRVDDLTERGDEGATEFDVIMGEWPYELSAGDYLRRQVRATPLPQQWRDAAPALAQVPEVVVFSSDYPHREGSPRPIDDLAPVLGDLDPETRERFLGGSILEVFERMGDPLPVVTYNC